MANEKTVEEIELQIRLLENTNKALSSHVESNNKLLTDLERERDILKYGKELECANCRYSIILDFTAGGYHNKCGKVEAPCTCCHNSCKYFEPHNEITKYFADHYKYELTPEEAYAYSVLIGNLFYDSWDKEIIERNKRIIKSVESEKRNWKE